MITFNKSIYNLYKHVNVNFLYKKIVLFFDDCFDLSIFVNIQKQVVYSKKNMLQ